MIAGWGFIEKEKVEPPPPPPGPAKGHGDIVLGWEVKKVFFGFGFDEKDICTLLEFEILVLVAACWFFKNLRDSKKIYVHT